MSENPGSDNAAALRLAVDAETRLRTWLAAALAAGAIEPAKPTVLPEWTVGHVLTHLARNADSHREMLRGDRQYGGSAKARNDAIDEGAVRSAAELVDDVIDSSTALTAIWDEAEWVGTATNIGGAEVASASLPLLRMREVEVHRTDLGLASPYGYTFAEMGVQAGEYVRRDLRQLEMIYKSRLPMGMTGLPPGARGLSPTQRLAWLMGRARVDGLQPANLFG